MKAEIKIADRAFRAAEFRAASLDEAERSVEVVWSTGSRVKRYSWDEGQFWEELSMEPQAIDLSRLNSGASFLDSHDQSGMASRLGAVKPGSARIENGKGVARILLSTSKSGDQILRDLAAGLPLLCSVGYRVSSYQKTESDDGSLPVYLATHWEPLEISAVAVPADPNAHARSDTPQPQHRTIPVTDRRAGSGADPLESMSMSTADPALAERERISTINQIATNHRVSPRLVTRAVDSGMPIPEFREAILDEMRARQERTAVFPVSPPHRADTFDVGDAPFAEILADAIHARVDRAHKPSEAARSFVGLSMPELARRAIEARGESTRGASAGELITRGLHSSSDFPIALGNVANRLVRKGYDATPSAIQQVARQATAKDFRPRASIFLQTKGGLEKVNEHGEYKRGTFAEGAELYAIETYGKIFGLTRQSLINDDLSLFDRLPQELGQKAKNFEADFLAKLIEGSRKMSDGLAVFHSSHANLAAAGSALSVTSLAAGRLAMRKQRATDGDLAGLVPQFLIVPSELELLGEQVLAQINAEKPSDVNPFSGTLQLLVEPRLTDSQAWFLAAGPDQSGLEYAFLEGAEGPQIETRQGFEIDGTEWKVRLDFGGGWQDFRGFWKNPGVAP